MVTEVFAGNVIHFGGVVSVGACGGDEVDDDEAEECEERVADVSLVCGAAHAVLLERGTEPCSIALLAVHGGR